VVPEFFQFFVSLCLCGAGLAEAQSPVPAPSVAPASPEFLDHYNFHLSADALSSGDERFSWQTHFGGDLDLVDYVPGREDDTRAILAPYPWDYLLGSIHWLDGFGIDDPPRLLDELGVEGAWRRYFEALTAAARTGLFDSLSHPDVVKIFGVRPSREVVEELHDGFAVAVADTGVAVEVSTAGLHKQVGELYPDPHLLAACRARRIPATMASDAHYPDVVGRDFDRARELLRSAGYETITVFDARKATQVSFDE